VGAAVPAGPAAVRSLRTGRDVAVGRPAQVRVRAEGASVLLFRDRALRRRAWFASAGRPGYPVLNPTVQSAKPAGPLAAAWAVLQHVGVDGYRELTLAAREALLTLAAEVSTVDGCGCSARRTRRCSRWRVTGGRRLRVRGRAAGSRLLRPGPTVARRRPAHLRFSAHGVSPSTVDALQAALRESVDAARTRGPATVPPETADALSEVDLSTVDEDGFVRLLNESGLSLDSKASVTRPSTPFLSRRASSCSGRHGHRKIA
jgi:sphinganine-1-phosphate aldolase